MSGHRCAQKGGCGALNLRISRLFLVALALASGACSLWHNEGFKNEQLPGIDAGCDPNEGLCQAAGLACTPELPSQTFTCQLPGPFFVCDSSVGCAAGLTCVDGECLQGCTSTADCGDPLTVCGTLEDGGASFCLVTQCGSPDGGGFWQPCGDGGGTCVVLGEFTFTLFGACLQGGSVAAGGNCEYYRGDGGLCAPGLVCTVDAAGDNSGVCMPVCDPFFDGGPNCGADTACAEFAIPAAPPLSYFDYYNHSGVCAQSCVPGDGGVSDGGLTDAGTPDAGTPDAGGPPASTTCAAPTSCTNASLTTTPTFVCLP